MVQARLFADGLAARISFLMLGLMVAASVLSGAAQAQAERGWNVCNRTSFIQEAAVARPEGRGIVVNGWTKIKPGDCETVLLAPLEPGVHFFYARSSPAHRGGLREWAGDRALCVDVTGSFSVESPSDCAAMGLESKDFRPILIGRRTGWTTILEETEDYSLETARAAGVQRLLDDAGVFSGRIDGNIGPKTRASIAEFLRSQKLAEDTGDADLIDILEQVAINRGRNIGLTLCNRTGSRISAAIARQRADGWESRGWWVLEAGGCVRTIDEELLLVPHFVYGQIEEAGGVRRLLRGADGFCIGRAKFVIQGRTDCEASGFDNRAFVATANPSNARIVFEFFDRDFGPLEPRD